MDVNEYIASGILEAYVLGGLSNKERQEVECISSIYEEVGDALKQLQSGFEKATQQNAVDPPEGLKVSVMEAIEKTPQEHGSKRALQESQGTEREETPVIPLHSSRLPIHIWRIAVVVLILVSAGLGFLYSTNRSELNKKSEEIAALEKSVGNTEGQLKSTDNKLVEQKTLNAFLTNKQTQKVVMPGSDNAPQASTNVYYNPSEDQIALQVDFLPEAPSDKQYQLWAIIDGKPTDMGVLKSDDLDNLKMIDYAYGTPDAFAITLEKVGGSDQPDLSNLYVIGEVRT